MGVLGSPGKVRFFVSKRVGTLHGANVFLNSVFLVPFSCMLAIRRE